jgi:hypothetical protein
VRITEQLEIAALNDKNVYRKTKMPTSLSSDEDELKNSEFGDEFDREKTHHQIVNY